MNFKLNKYRKKIAGFTFILYISITAFAAFHYHSTDLDNEIQFSNFKLVQKDIFKDENNCKLYNFSNSQILNIENSNEIIIPIIGNNLISNIENIAYLKFYSNYSKRGPPELI